MGEIRVFYRDRFLCSAVSAEPAGETIPLGDITRARDQRRRELRSNYALFPIYGFQADLVPAPGLECTFTSGAGTLTYSVSPGVLSVQTGNTCGGAQPGTGENSNVVYQEGVCPASGSTVRQSFAVPPQG